MQKFMKLTALTLLAVMVLFVMAACDKKDEAPAGEKKDEVKTEVKAETEEEPKEETKDEGMKEEVKDGGRPSTQVLFAGSSTLAPVITKISTDFFEEFGKWNKVDASLSEKNIDIYVSSGGSGQGISALVDGTTDFAMVARGVKDEEKAKIANYEEYLIGVDALTLAVNPKNPIAEKMNDLTTEQIVDIFSGKYAKWSDISPDFPAEDIVVVTRDLNGGAHEVFQSKIMKDAEVKADSIQAASMGELVKIIIENPSAIGYASFGLVNQHKGELIPLLVNGVEPTVENILNESYPIQRPLLLATSAPLSTEEKLLIERFLSDKGQDAVESMGFIRVK